MVTYVLLHPAWFGGWCWAKVAPLLAARGHLVLTPTLTGLGERRHLAGRDVGLETHVADVVGVLECEDLRDVILVGNSSGGVVITGVADRVPDRVANLVYLDAFVPEDGESMLDLAPPQIVAGMKALAEREGDGWLVPRIAPPPWEAILKGWEITDARDVAWAVPRLAATPLRHFSEPVRRRNPAAETIPRTYIRCPRRANPGYDRYAENAKRMDNWRALALDASHIPYISAPRETADALVSLA